MKNDESNDDRQNLIPLLKERVDKIIADIDNNLNDGNFNVIKGDVNEFGEVARDAVEVQIKNDSYNTLELFHTIQHYMSTGQWIYVSYRRVSKTNLNSRSIFTRMVKIMSISIESEIIFKFTR